MLVKILSGAQRGEVVEMSEREAEVALPMGFAARVIEDEPIPVTAAEIVPEVVPDVEAPAVVAKVAKRKPPAASEQP